MTFAETTDSREKMRLTTIAAAVLVAFFLEVAVQRLWAAQRTPLLFDDAYMFARYAMNVRHGLGVSWNLDGVHTFGETSLLWGAVVWAFSFLPVGAWKMLTLASWLCGLGAVGAMAWAVARNAVSPVMQSTWRVLPLVALPLAASVVFATNAVTGMETMLAMLLLAVFVGLALAWSAGKAGPVTVGVAGIGCFLARPESALAVVLLPVLLWSLLRGAMTLRGMAAMLGVFALGVTGVLLACRLYFHSALPLAFYIKGGSGYEGYAEVWHPELLMMEFFAGCQIFLAAVIVLARREDWRLLVCCMTPALAVFAYLFRVTQIMGLHARYYVPYLAFFVVPALLLVDRRVAVERGERRVLSGLTNKTGYAWRVATVGLMMLVFLGLSSERVQAAVRHAEGRRHVEYDAVVLETAAQTPLPMQDWASAMASVTDDLVAQMPVGATVAATEVGYLGSRSPQVNVIDMAGLNDMQIARHGFDAAALLARRPDVIWLPNDSYTYMRGELLTEPALLREYDVYAGAARFGVAIRKRSRFHAAVERTFEEFWSSNYPGLRMDDYRVRTVRWTGQKHGVVGS